MAVPFTEVHCCSKNDIYGSYKVENDFRFELSAFDFLIEQLDVVSKGLERSVRPHYTWYMASLEKHHGNN